MGLSFAAPHAGRDAGDLFYRAAGQDFNPRTPCGVRRRTRRTDLLRATFQSTHPLRGATLHNLDKTISSFISIHAPLAGCDFRQHSKATGRLGFQSTHPLRGATALRQTLLCQPLRFQSTHPLRGATAPITNVDDLVTISIHAPLAGCDSKSAQKNAALLRKRYKYKLFVCKKCTSGNLTGAYSSKNTLYSGAKRSENPCALSVRTHRISGPSTSNPGLMPKCSILERYFSPR